MTELRLGATPLERGRCGFRVWAPRARRVDVSFSGEGERTVALERGERGYHAAIVENTPAGSLYRYRLDGGDARPDPASRHQPRGVHGPSRVIDTAGLEWRESTWAGLDLERYVFYELHVGAFTAAGTFDAVIAHLEELKSLGVTAIELMPIAQFPGSRNWGYDGVLPYAVQNSYGGPEGLHRLVDACHALGLAVALDVVYNHIGPEGNHLGEFGPYFSRRRRTPWGDAINFDGESSEEVRHYFIENALYWITDFHVDALRLDAIHAIRDLSAAPFLAELADAVHRRAGELGRRVQLIAESDIDDLRIVQSREEGGLGHDARWNDGFHRSLHAVLTGERNGYYRDYGRLSDLAKVYREGFVFPGESPRSRGSRRGAPAAGVAPRRHVVFSQNHDQVGNRMLGERLGSLVSFGAMKLAAGAVVLSPYVPLIFMGEEYGETNPFLYFVSHTNPSVIDAVRRGRRSEFASFGWKGEAPDPQDEATFLRSKLDHGRKRIAQHRVLFNFYAELLRLRREVPALAAPNADGMEAGADEESLLFWFRRGSGSEVVLAMFNFGSEPLQTPVPRTGGDRVKRLDSAEREWGGDGSVVPTVIGSAANSPITLSGESFVLFA